MGQNRPRSFSQFFAPIFREIFFAKIIFCISRNFAKCTSLLAIDFAFSDPNILQELEPYKKKLQQLGKFYFTMCSNWEITILFYTTSLEENILGVTNVDLETSRSKESRLGNFITDGMVWVSSECNSRNINSNITFHLVCQNTKECSICTWHCKFRWNKEGSQQGQHNFWWHVFNHSISNWCGYIWYQREVSKTSFRTFSKHAFWRWIKSRRRWRILTG